MRSKAALGGGNFSGASAKGGRTPSRVSNRTSPICSILRDNCNAYRLPGRETRTRPVSRKRQGALRSAVPLFLPSPLREAAPHSPLSRADGVTPVTRPHLLASSFSRRLRGDFRRSSPAASHRPAALWKGNKRATRPHPRQMFSSTL